MRQITFLLAFILLPVLNWAQDISVSFDHVSGRYDSLFTLKISSNAEKLIYTTDGSTPTKRSKVLEGELLIDQHTFLKVSPFMDGKILDTVIAASYVIGFETALPILSVGMESDDLWDERNGIYVKGKNAEYNEETEHWEDCNFQQRWEKPIHIIYVDSNGVEGLNQACGIRIFGESTRRLPDKSMKVVARNKYGKNRFNYTLFPQKEISEHKQFVIRTSGNDYRKARFKDVMNAHIARNMGIDYMGFQAVQLFVNGEYWGLYNIREKINKYYLYYNHGAALDSSSIVMGRWVKQHGSGRDYMKMYRFFEKLDTMDNRAYTKVQSMLDIRNYINYRVFQLYLSNRDSRGNIRYWNSQDQDSRFRMILYDTDLGYGNASRPFLEKSLSPKRTDWFNPEWSTMYLRKLVQNDSFRNEFITQVAHLMNTTLSRDTMLSVIDSFEEMYKDELPRPGDEIADHLKKVPMSMKEWQKNLNQFRMFAKIRPKRFLPRVDSLLNDSRGMYHLSVNGKGGRVEINDNYGQDLSFDGDYFVGVPVSIKAVPADGWEFLGWADSTEQQTRYISGNEGDVELEALFKLVDPEISTVEISPEVEAPNVEEHVASSPVNWCKILTWVAYTSILIGFVLFILSFVIYKPVA